MVSKVIKRDGTVVPFDSKRIENAIKKAGHVRPSTIQKIIELISGGNIEALSVETIQDLVEKYLMESSYKDVAREYIRYRKERELIRETVKSFDSVLKLIENKNEYLKTENSNKNVSIGSTQRDYMAGEVSKDLCRRLILPKDIVEAHDKGIIHFHDMDYFIQHLHNCCLVNLEDILQNGTVINGTKIEKPHSFSTACTIATQVAAVVASNQYGGQTISLTHLAPFVEVSRRKFSNDLQENLALTGLYLDPETYEKILDRKVRAEIAKGVQTLQYQVNTIMSSNGQTPFITIFMYLGETSDPQTKKDLALIIEEVLKQRIQGVKNEVGEWITPAFPKLIYCLEEDNIGEDSPYYYLTVLAAQCTAKRMVPDYLSEKKLLDSKYPTIMKMKDRRDSWGDETVWGKNVLAKLTDEQCEELDSLISDPWNYLGDHNPKHYLGIAEKYGLQDKDIVPIAYPCMGCRSFLTADPIHYKYYGRFNQGVVTINLPYLALLASTKEDPLPEFWDILTVYCNLCRQALQIRHRRLLNTPSGTSPLHWEFGALSRLEKGSQIDPLLFDNYSTISLGYAGLYEAVKVLTDKSHTEPGGTELAVGILQFLNNFCKYWRKEENISYSVYGTPIESTTYKFAKALQRDFGENEVTKYGYVTNSYHVCVREPIDPFTKLDLEGKFQELSPGGCISYIETADLQNNIGAVLQVMSYIYNHITYAELNTKSDYCQVCGYDGEIQIVQEGRKLIWKCPNCGNTDQSKMNVARRTCGYIGANFWNQGRTEEIRDRYVHLGSVQEVQL